jgi:hypothetical protein
MRRFATSIAAILLCLGVYCLNGIDIPHFKTAQAQVPMTGAGLGAPAVAASYQGPCDAVTGCVAAYGLMAYDAAFNGAAVNVCIEVAGSDTTCADVSVNGSTVTVPAGLSTCNNSTNICTVKIIYDQTANAAGKCTASCNLQETTVANRANFVIPGSGNGCPLSTQYCVAAVSTTTTYSLASGSITLGQPFTMSVVGERTSHSTQGRLAASTASNSQLGWENANNELRLYLGSSATDLTGIADSSWHAMQFVGNNTTSTINADGTSSGNVSPGTGGWSAEQMNIIGSQGLYGFIGYWGEEVFWPTATSVSTINTNAHARWGF